MNSCIIDLITEEDSAGSHILENLTRIPALRSGFNRLSAPRVTGFICYTFNSQEFSWRGNSNKLNKEI